MAIALALVGLLVAIAACILGAKGWRTSQRLALEMVQLRDRLTRAEQGYREAVHAAASAQPGRPAHDVAWAPRMEAVERRLRAALERDDDGDEERAEPDTRRAIRRHLKRDGYERIAILGEEADGVVVLEAERGGVTTKGRAEILADGTVRLHGMSSLRAFP